MKHQFVSNPSNPNLKIRLIQLASQVSFLQVIGDVRDTDDIALANDLVKASLKQNQTGFENILIIDLTHLTHLPRVKDAVDQSKYLRTKKMGLMIFILPKQNPMIKTGMAVITEFAQRVFELKIAVVDSPDQVMLVLEQKFPPTAEFWKKKNELLTQLKKAVSVS